jgi:hypothetical protein
MSDEEICKEATNAVQQWLDGAILASEAIAAVAKLIAGIEVGLQYKALATK